MAFPWPHLEAVLLRRVPLPQTVARLLPEASQVRLRGLLPEASQVRLRVPDCNLASSLHLCLWSLHMKHSLNVLPSLDSISISFWPQHLNLSAGSPALPTLSTCQIPSCCSLTIRQWLESSLQAGSRSQSNPSLGAGLAHSRCCLGKYLMNTWCKHE